MKFATLMLLVAFAALPVCGSSLSAGELAPSQKSDAVQKTAVDNAVQKDALQKDASQKSDASDEPVGFWERRREFRVARIEARQARWTVAAVCRSGSCR